MMKLCPSCGKEIKGDGIIAENVWGEYKVCSPECKATLESATLVQMTNLQRGIRVGFFGRRLLVEDY